ncbi:Vacuolar protein-sorting-associated protein 36 [Coemansia sp. RSA 1813]|nr:Vacuolar protein-sorting-associated protein 36 [Coemansia sp. RSA 1646]KAJ1767293.1 Vacuolar protein-sorting-associated protein 36 [Coemansia sp. RSA 1843]KAJ2089446.1 Vacuolar protein-sorting-associated protein 36 [Coemansia sp. RSA 986]KAJ2214918.1 Vacuolar protein-sorting-associated protein 36 [Coemansia sp. RSA 487]KAJ2563811.1 Vacuolar protein-sorting-associated protein 36 [Coemansia sp. RSA 1813]
MEPVEIAPTLRPLLDSGEKILCIQAKVGLYKGDLRDEEHDNGTLYLTNQRLVYVDQQTPHERSVELHLSHVQKCTLHSGFLYSSGKIILSLRPVTRTSNRRGSESQQTQAESRKYAWVSPYSSLSLETAQSSDRFARPQTALGSGSGSGVNDWMCSICENVNKGDMAKCALCGVPRQASAIPVEDNKELEMAIAKSKEQATRCPVCTFDNHNSMARCEMCDAELLPQATEQHAGGSTGVGGIMDQDPPVPPYAEEEARGGGASSADFIKLSFRGGGSSSFYSSLKSAVNSSTWLVVGMDPAFAAQGTTAQSAHAPQHTRDSRPTGGGISTLVSTAHETERARDATLRSAFSDLDALTAMANEIVGMAEQIATQLNSPAASKLRARGGGESDEDTAERANAFRQYLLDLGIDSPVTKDTAGAAFHEELARELCDFLENYVDKCGGTVALVDAYCLYNRAREFSLVYPSDFAQACSKFAPLRLLLRLREYPSGLLAIEDSSSANDALIISRVKRYIQSFGPVTASDVAAIEDCPLTLAEERLWICEQAAQVCRDESVEGVRYYSNIFVCQPPLADEQWHII